MKFSNIKAWAVALTMAAFSSQARALPTLQLDAFPGTYDPATGVETTIATANPFMIRALIKPDSLQFGTNGLTRNYYLSVAITPGANDPGFGSFTFDGIQTSSSNMIYGTPPVESDLSAAKDPGDLASHGAFPAYFAQFEFNLDPTQKVNSYNVADNNAGSETALYTPGSNFLYYMDFEVNILGLTGQPNSPYALHFDLYNTVTEVTNVYSGKGKKAKLVGSTTDIDVDQFAPFSHDAESGHGIVVKSPPPRVPDGGQTLLMLGSALSCIGILRWKFGKKAA